MNCIPVSYAWKLKRHTVHKRCSWKRTFVKSKNTARLSFSSNKNSNQRKKERKKKRKISGNGGRRIDEVLLGSKHLLRWHPSSSRSKFPLPILKFVIRQCLVVPIWNWRLFVHRLVLESKCLSSISSELWILQIQPSLISPWYSNLSQLKPHAITKLV